MTPGAGAQPGELSPADGPSPGGLLAYRSAQGRWVVAAMIVMFFYPIAGDRKLPAVATRDIAAAASRLLLDASWSGAGEVPLLGPEDLSFNDMAGIMPRVLGKDVRFRQITFEAYKDRFVRLGMSDAMAQGYTDLAWAKNEGLDNGVQRTQQNSTPTSFRQWCDEVLKPAVAS